MPVLVQWIMDVFPKMGSVLGLFGFVFLVFGIIGMELFKGSLHYRCSTSIDAMTDTSHTIAGAVASRALRERPGEAASAVPHGQWREGLYDSGIPCRMQHDQCPVGTRCAFFDSNPNSFTSFDSVPLAFISLVMTSTFDEWAEPMYSLMASFSPYVWIYFALVVLLGGFFVTNLFLAVIFLEYGSSKERVQHAELMEAKRITAQKGDDDTRRLLDGLELLSDASPHGPRTPELGRAESSRFDGSVEISVETGAMAPPIEGRCRRAVASIASSSQLSAVATSLVLINMVIMCMPYQGMTAAYADGLERWATGITWLFILEMAIKLFGLGCHGYWSDGWNVLDGTIVIMSMLEMALTAYFAAEGIKLSFLRILRILRVVRVLRLMRSWQGLYKIITTFLRAMPQMRNLFVLIILCMFMFSLLGMQLFGAIYTPANGYSLADCPGGICTDGLKEKPPFHFDYCAPAMITIFILLTGEWVDAMSPVTAILGPDASAFFIYVVLLGKFFLLNLLIAVILCEFGEDAASPPSSPGKTPRRSLASPPATDDPAAVSHLPHTDALPMPSARESGPDGDGWAWLKEGENDAFKGSRGVKHDLSNGGLTMLGFSKRFAQRMLPVPEEDIQWPRDYSLLVFAPRNPIRRLCHQMIRQPIFDQLLVVAIIASSILLAVDSPRLDTTSLLYFYLRCLDVFFTALFISEMCIKVGTGKCCRPACHVLVRFSSPRAAPWPLPRGLLPPSSALLV